MIAGDMPARRISATPFTHNFTGRGPLVPALPGVPAGWTVVENPDGSVTATPPASS